MFMEDDGNDSETPAGEVNKLWTIDDQIVILFEISLIIKHSSKKVTHRYT